MQQDSALTPQEEFKAALESMGAIVDGEHPIMDGGSHRVAMEGDKKGEKAGFYVAHLDGMPAGYIKNNRTGAELKWKSKGYVLSDEQKKAFAAIALENKKHRDINTEKRHKETALKLSQKLSLMDELTKPTPYIQSKGIGLHSGIYTDKENNLTCIPAADIDGVVWSVQYISEDGTKRFAKDSKKEGCFHVLGGMDKLSDTPAIIIAEGYATAATLKEATELPCVICAFDSGNLAPVAKAIHEKYPSTPIVIAADDDKYLEQTKGINPGKEKAFEAANAVNGIVILPIFAPGEQSLHPKKFSDFNDMAHHSSLKLAGVARQVNPKIDKIAKRHRYLVQSKKNNVVRIA